MTLTNLPRDPLLDLDPWVGQRSATFRFALTNAVSGLHLGNVTPIRGATLSHDTARTIKRQLQISLGKADTAAINPISDRINVFMIFPGGKKFPLGKYMFVDSSLQRYTSGALGQMVLNDEMFLIDQRITAGISSTRVGDVLGRSTVAEMIQKVLAGLPVTFQLEPCPFNSAEAWAIGASRGQILETLAVSGDYFSPWINNLGVLTFIRTFDPAKRIPDFDFDTGRKVIRSSVLETNNLLTAPNTFIVVSNTSDDPASQTVGRATVPINAPNSIVNRGFAITDVQDLQLSTTAQAQAVADGLAVTQTILEMTHLVTAPDPRHDSYNVIRWRNANWLELSWTMQLIEGGSMTHLLRKAYD